MNKDTPDIIELLADFARFLASQAYQYKDGDFSENADYLAWEFSRRCKRLAALVEAVK